MQTELIKSSSEQLSELYEEYNELKRLQDSFMSEEQLMNRPNSRIRMMLDSTKRIDWLKSNPESDEIDYVKKEIVSLKRILNK
jgi:hypothetical protein